MSHYWLPRLCAWWSSAGQDVWPVSSFHHCPHQHVGGRFLSFSLPSSELYLLFPSFFFWIISASLVLSSVDQTLVILGNSEIIFCPGVFNGYVQNRSFVLMPQCCKMAPVFSSENQRTTNTSSDTPTNLCTNVFFPFSYSLTSLPSRQHCHLNKKIIGWVDK